MYSKSLKVLMKKKKVPEKTNADLSLSTFFYSKKSVLLRKMNRKIK